MGFLLQEICDVGIQILLQRANPTLLHPFSILPDKCVQHAPLRSAAMPSEICSHQLQALREDW